jgi:hypothetical protein
MFVKYRTFILYAALALTPAAFSQRFRLPSKQDSAVALAYTPSAQSAAQMTTVLKVITHVEVAFDAGHAAFALHGDASNLNLAEWLLHQMDKPEGWQPTELEAGNPSSRTYLSASSGIPFEDIEPVTHIYYLKSSTQLEKQEILTIARIVGLTPYVFLIDKPRILVFRGNATSVDLLEWMIQKLDVPTGGVPVALQSQNPQSGVYALPKTSDGGEDVVRIFYLSASTSQKALFSMVKNIRDTTNARNVFSKTAPPVIAIRGTPSLIAQAQQIIDAAQ